MSGTISIFEDGKEVYIDQKFNDGSGGISRLRKRGTMRGTRYDFSEIHVGGDYFILNGVGIREVWDDEGMITKAYLLK
jgi:hypothetical protein